MTFSRTLFDAGGQYQAFADNVRKLNIDLKTLDFVVISHRHGDHTGGLAYVLERNPHDRRRPASGRQERPAGQRGGQQFQIARAYRTRRRRPLHGRIRTGRTGARFRRPSRPLRH
ncbi:MBL fold metallo-hydrolase [Duganella sp. FT109W]|uniref:MBL fold metallo-hydrolase n=1 Tax=Duganella margarita TaxID=2692170 RepID=A0ABW9WPI5_9BURK|nr:MBL fold metallo-hydrolase [Duganella margarita]